jgi:AAA domain-containing protein
MPSLSQHQSNEYTKMLIEGDPGTGKSGGLTSLVKAGYWLGILDFDNGLESLKQFILRECPDKINNVEYRTLRDKHKASPNGPVIDGPPKAFIEGLKMLDRWKYTDDNGTEIDYGVPASWGPDRILVLDSLTFFSKAAFDFREPLVPRSAGGKYDQRAVYKDAQDAIEKVLGFIQSESFRTNVIVITHIKYVDNEDGTRKGYPTSIGAALSPTIPAYFNSVALCRTKAGGKRVIQTAATALIDLKNPKPFAMLPEYPIETGLADFFAVLREQPNVTGPGPSEDKVQPLIGQRSGQSESHVRRINRPVRRI